LSIDPKWIIPLDSQLGTEITILVGQSVHRHLDRRSFIGGSDARVMWI